MGHGRLCKRYIYKTTKKPKKIELWALDYDKSPNFLLGKQAIMAAIALPFRAAETKSLPPLWPSFEYKLHQVSGIKWMLQREMGEMSGGLLCDEMGLGKTMEVLGTIANSKLKQTLLLCPKAVIAQWVAAATKSKMNVMTYDKASNVWKRISPLSPPSPWLYISNYEKLVGKMRLFDSYSWDRIVLDEAHRVRNGGGSIYKAIESLNRKTLWAVTATPIVNNIKDMNNLFALVGYNKTKLTNSNYRIEVIEEACLHRSMAEMRETIPELPAAANITKEVLDFETEEEGDFYRSIQGKIAARWKHLDHDNTKEMFVLLMRLRQLSLHPQVYISAMKRRSVLGYPRADWEEPSTKFTALRKKLEEAGPPAKWIVFCQFHDEMEILQAYLEKSPAVKTVWQYHGGLTDAEKDGVIESTKAEVGGKHEVLLLQLQSGGVGLNLQHFSKIIFMSPWWTAALMDQAVGRAVRIGQKGIVEVTLLVLKEEDSMNIDEKMLEKADEKRGMLVKALQHASRGLAPVVPVAPVVPLAPLVPDASAERLEEAEEAEEAEDPAN
jgi:SNF2 family DNA or RNA helicase